MSLISTRLVSPKFLLASSSCSVHAGRDRRGSSTPIFCRQLRLRTDSSKSVTGMLSTWLMRSRFFCASSS